MKPQETSNTWEIDSISSVPKFLTAMARYLPRIHTVSFEIQEVSPDVLKVYRKHSTPAKYIPLRDTIFPKTKLYYCRISEDLACELEEILRHHQVTDVFWHVKGFNDQRLQFAIHDADSAFPAYLSADLDSKSIHAIAQAVGQKPAQLHTEYEWQTDQRRK